VSEPFGLGRLPGREPRRSVSLRSSSRLIPVSAGSDRVWMILVRAGRMPWSRKAIRSASSLDLHVERPAQSGVSGIRDQDRPTALGSANPVQLDEPVQQAPPQATREVVALLAPVDAIAHELSPGRGAYSELFEVAETGIGDPIVHVAPVSGALVVVGDGMVEPAVAARQMPAFDQCGHELNAQTPGEMVVAGTRPAQRVSTAVLPQRPHRRSRRHLLPGGWRGAPARRRGRAGFGTAPGRPPGRRRQRGQYHRPRTWRASGRVPRVAVADGRVVMWPRRGVVGKIFLDFPGVQTELLQRSSGDLRSSTLANSDLPVQYLRYPTRIARVHHHPPASTSVTT
jgi:hypothetical protein